MKTYATGDRVRLDCPENERLHGASAVVAAVAPWGCHVRTTAAATGRYRASWDELRPDQGASGDICGDCGSANMTRAGSCLLCKDCGSTSGGCG